MFDIILTSSLTLIGFSVVLALALRRFRSQMINIVDSIGDIFSEIVTQPTVSKAFGILGSKSGEARAEKATLDQLAGDIINGPKFAGLKVGAQMLGVDLDSYIEQHGAMNTISAMQQLAGSLGINVQDLIEGGGAGLQMPAQTGSGNPYL